nr:hypothetical protein [Pandoravirus massiliensis]
MAPCGASGLGVGRGGVWTHNCCDDAQWQSLPLVVRDGAVLFVYGMVRLRLLFFGCVPEAIAAMVASRFLEETRTPSAQARSRHPVSTCKRTQAASSSTSQIMGSLAVAAHCMIRVIVFFFSRPAFCYPKGKIGGKQGMSKDTQTRDSRQRQTRIQGSTAPKQKTNGKGMTKKETEMHRQ